MNTDNVVVIQIGEDEVANRDDRDTVLLECIRIMRGRFPNSELFVMLNHDAQLSVMTNMAPDEIKRAVVKHLSERAAMMPEGNGSKQ